MKFLKQLFRKNTSDEKLADSSYGHALEDISRTKGIVYDVFDGEKTQGELGDIVSSVPDHLGLRLRAFDLDLKTDIIKVITGKFFKFVVGSGLKLQAEPKGKVLSIFGINEDLEKFKEEVESLYSLYSESEYSDYTKKDCIHDKAAEAFKAAFLGGDCLTVIRVEKEGPNIQVIDGQQVETPFDDKGKAQGNTIKHGIEMNGRGEHVAFWVCVETKIDGEVKHQRILAKNDNGNVVARMVYGDKARIDHHRGIPRISSILEKVSKLDRYVEASVSKAEQTANIVYAFEHDENSTGENPLVTNLSSRKKAEDDCRTTFEKTGRTADSLRQSTSGTVLNLPNGSKINSLSAPSETNFNEFFRSVFVVLCASVDIPEEVALQKYEQNYSSSRAAINGWDYIVGIYRKKFARDFYRPFYRVWLDYNVYKGNIKSNGFLKARGLESKMALEAYYNARFLGRKMPHIDPLKEAKAVRSMLGDDITPLISREQAVEYLGSGDWSENYKKYTQESKSVSKEDLSQQNTGQDVKN